jgi:hypothetical protein
VQVLEEKDLIAKVILEVKNLPDVLQKNKKKAANWLLFFVEFLL